MLTQPSLLYLVPVMMIEFAPLDFGYSDGYVVRVLAVLVGADRSKHRGISRTGCVCV